MPIKKLDFKFVNELRRNQHIKEIVEVINNNADELDDNLLLINNSLETLFDGYSGDNASTKKIYWHNVRFIRYGVGVYYIEGFLIVLNNSPDELGVNDIKDLLTTQGFYGVVINGLMERTGGASGPSSTSLPLIGLRAVSATSFYAVYRDSDNVIQNENVIFNDTQWTITDLVNAIN